MSFKNIEIPGITNIKEMPVGNFSWLRSTRQLWKFTVFVCGILFFSGACLYELIFRREMPFYDFPPLLLGLPLFVWLPWTLRCPACKSKVYWLLWKKRLPLVHNPWIALEHIKVCPQCGDDGTQKA